MKCLHKSPSGLYICTKEKGHAGKHKMVWVDDALRRYLARV